MPPSPRSKAGARAEPAQPGRRQPKLNAMMACDTAFRIVARRYLGDLAANHEATCNGDTTALHQMRIALTRLRTAILFFSPMVADTQRTRIRDELKWVNGHLGVARDLDVAIDRLRAADKKQPQAIPHYRSWEDKRTDGHRQLARALRSARYRRLAKSTSEWIENGPWSTSRGKQATKDRAAPIAAYSADKLARWQERLLKKGRNLAKLDTEKRHQVRLLNKKLTYSIECFEDLFDDKRFSKQRAGLKHLRKAQRALGQLNDDVRGRSLAATLQRDGVPADMKFFGPKREKRLIRSAAMAYRKVAEL